MQKNLRSTFCRRRGRSQARVAEAAWRAASERAAWAPAVFAGAGVFWWPPPPARGRGRTPRRVLDAFVAAAAGHDRGGADRGHLDHDPGAEETAAGRDGSAAATEERAERGGNRHRRERADRRPLRTLAAGEARTVVALAQVGAQRALVLAREPAVQLLRDRELGLVAGEPALELLAERA